MISIEMIRDTPPFVGGASYLYENLWGWELGWRVQKKETLLQHRVKCEMGGVSEGSSRRVPGGRS